MTSRYDPTPTRVERKLKKREKAIRKGLLKFDPHLQAWYWVNNSEGRIYTTRDEFR